MECSCFSAKSFGFFYFVLFWLCFKHGYDLIGLASNTKTFIQESVTLNITYGLRRLLLTTLTTLGLYGGSIFLSYKSCQSIVLKNGWHLISSCWEADHVKVTYYLVTYEKDANICPNYWSSDEHVHSTWKSYKYGSRQFLVCQTRNTSTALHVGFRTSAADYSVFDSLRLNITKTHDQHKQK